MKSEKKPFSFTLFLTGGATAKIFYSNGFWEFNEKALQKEWKRLTAKWFF